MAEQLLYKSEMETPETKEGSFDDLKAQSAIVLEESRSFMDKYGFGKLGEWVKNLVDPQVIRADAVEHNGKVGPDIAADAIADGVPSDAIAELESAAKAAVDGRDEPHGLVDANKTLADLEMDASLLKEVTQAA